jgi:hypothetical protein
MIAALTPAGCVADHDPAYDFRWQGDRIDVVGIGTQPDQTCAGTLPYLDQFAEATAREFGVAGHLGVYRWYSSESFAQSTPCPDLAVGCTGANGVFTRLMPHEHEVVHLANNQVIACPSVIAEGLAEFYSPTSSTPTSGDIEALIQDSEHGAIGGDGYPLAGAFVAFLVERHGVESVLQLCAESGPYPSPATFSEAMHRALAVPLEDVLSEFEDFDCTYTQYRSKHFDCDDTESVDILVGEDPAEARFDLDCQSMTTIGPRAAEIWTVGRMEVLTDGIYLAEAIVTGEATGVRVQLIECRACADQPRTHTLVGNDSIDPIQLRAGRYSVHAIAPAGFSGSIVLRITS